MVEDAVGCEPVSASKFPANREINREFRRIRSFDAILNADTRGNSEACTEIPYSTEQGIILAEQGISTRRTGNLTTGVTGEARLLQRLTRSLMALHLYTRSPVLRIQSRNSSYRIIHLVRRLLQSYRG